VYPESVGNVRNHFANFKVDLDIYGQANRVEYIYMKKEPHKTHPDLPPPPPSGSSNADKTNIFVWKMIPELKRREKETSYDHSLTRPTYVLVTNANATNQYGNARAYRILPLSMAKLMVPEIFVYKSINWAQYLVKHHYRSITNWHGCVLTETGKVNGKIRNLTPVASKPLNRSSSKLSWVITLGTCAKFHSEPILFHYMCEVAHESDFSYFLGEGSNNLLPARGGADFDGQYVKRRLCAQPFATYQLCIWRSMTRDGTHKTRVTIRDKSPPNGQYAP